MTETYVPQAERKWVLIRPGATQRFIGAPPVPPPDRIFGEAYIVAKGSDPVGLVSLYADVGESHKTQIEQEIELLCQRSPPTCETLRLMATTKGLTWLERATE